MRDLVIKDQVVCGFPVQGFTPIRKGEGMAFMGKSASGKTIRLIGLAVQFLVQGKKVGVLSDELGEETIVQKVTEEIKKHLVFEGVSSEIAALEAMKHHLVIFDSFQVLEESFRAGQIDDLSLILCDTVYKLGRQTEETQAEFVERELSVLDDMREKLGMVTAYAMQIRATQPEPLKGVEDEPLAQNLSRLFHLQKIEGLLHMTELTNSGQVLATTIGREAPQGYAY